MKCFEWINHISDHLDHTLPSDIESQSKGHLAECTDCSERLKHYELILGSVSSRPRISVPHDFKKATQASARPKISVAHLSRARWDALPWYARKSIEAAAMIALIITVVSAVPKLRTLYEHRLEKNLSDFNDGFNLADVDSESAKERLAGGAQLSRGKLAPTTPGQEGDDAQSQADDFSGDSDEASSEGREVKAGASEIWRFSLKTDSPYDMRPKIVQLLTELKVAPNTPGIGGIEAPGGIQFDILINQASVPSLKKQLEHLTPRTAANEGESEAFTWYKNESKRRIPDGKTRVVIWLSQM